MLTLEYRTRQCNLVFQDHEQIAHYREAIAQTVQAITPYLEHIDARLSDGSLCYPGCVCIRVDTLAQISIAIPSDNSRAVLLFVNGTDMQISNNIPIQYFCKLKDPYRLYELEDRVKNFGVRDFEKTLTMPLHKKIHDYFER